MVVPVAVGTAVLMFDDSGLLDRRGLIVVAAIFAIGNLLVWRILLKDEA